ncbi:MAG: hypothetical protein VX519_03755 [Myxococcota bacterium]|nr:hypothetical protein [Myxococcota bacterium]
MNALYRVHAVMISLATVFCAGFGVWSFRNEDQGSPIMGGFFAIASVALGIYLVRFMRDKQRQVEK